MEMKKYLSGVVLLVLVSSASAMENASVATRAKDFCNKNKIALGAAAGTFVVGAGVAGVGAWCVRSSNDPVAQAKKVITNKAKSLKNLAASEDAKAKLKAAAEKVKTDNKAEIDKKNTELAGKTADSPEAKALQVEIKALEDSNAKADKNLKLAELTAADVTEAYVLAEVAEEIAAFQKAQNDAFEQAIKDGLGIKKAPVA